MSRKADPTLIGIFVLGAIALAVTTILLVAGDDWFRKHSQHLLYFEGAAHGLQVGAPVVFLGVKVGTVKKIQLGLDESNHQFVVPVTIEVEPQVVRTRSGERIDLRDRETLRRLVERGLRARLRLQSILTGQLYVDLDFHPDKPARFVAADPAVSEIPTIRTAVQELTRKLEGFPMDTFLADVMAIGASLSRTLDTPETRNLPKRMDATLKHLESLAARLDAKSGPILEETRADLVEMKKALVAAQAAMARLEGAADRVGALAGADSELVRNLTQASAELAGAAQTVRRLAESESPTVQHANQALKEIARAAEALRKLAELLEQQPDAILRGKRKVENP
ncbi:MAG: MCE family protein [Betaproteobacteria bacterium]|nr:MCE family protein [Betaproteobacteria bacterium]